MQQFFLLNCCRTIDSYRHIVFISNFINFVEIASFLVIIELNEIK